MADDEDAPYDREDHKTACLNLIVPIDTTFPKNRVRDVMEGLYTFSELGLFGDIDVKEAETAILIWALVEKVRQDGFPRELRM
jgi:hypothetical protein